MKLRDILDSIREDLQEIKVILAKQEINIEHHVKRTDLLEKAHNHHMEDFEPVKKHVLIVNSITKILVVSVGVTSAVVGILKALL